MNIFSRYSPAIQRYIYEEGWQSLRAIQAAAGDAIFNTDANVLLSASTAAGKTEAAFFPIITLLQEQPPASIGCLYIAPLKALINDQFVRLNDICRECGVEVWHWHGDVSQEQKKKLMRHPSGILQITPESLEAMLMHRHSQIPSLFGDLRFVVIDEIHSFLRGDRGGQTLCLLERLQRLAGVVPRRVGLSATIGDLKMVGNFLAAGTGRGTVIPRVKVPGAKWRISVAHFFNNGEQAKMPVQADARIALPEEQTSITGGILRGHYDKEEINGYDPFQTNVWPSRPSDIRREMKGGSPFNQNDDNANARPTTDNNDRVNAGSNDSVYADNKDPLTAAADPGLLYVFNHTRGHKCLVFSNSREECETVCATLRMYCEAVHEPDRFLIHHGNLSTSYRESAEEEMKRDDSLATVCTTSTLELGIDIGRLERAFQIDAPFTVSSFLQRMGRTGRRGAPSEMWFVIREDHAEQRALMPETIPWKLLQAIALIELYLKDHWVEPPRTGRLPYSLLYHQTMSTLASGGEMTPAELARRVLTLSYFHHVSQDDYRVLLRHLLKIDHIETTERGGLIVGLKGERVVNNFKFYAVFQDNEEYKVRCESQELGTIVKPPPVRDKIAIAGRVWVVEEVDRNRHVVYCHPVKGIVPAYFGDEPGDIHTRILEKMHDILAPVDSAFHPEASDHPSDGQRLLAYSALLPHARARLAQARDAAAKSELGVRWLLPLGGRMYAFFPWLGSYAFLAMERFLRIRCGARLGLKGFDSVRPYYMQFTMSVSPEEFFALLAEEIQKPLDAMELLYPNETPIFDKYDDILPVELTRKGFAYGVLDVKGMAERVRQMCGVEGVNRIGSEQASDKNS